MNALPNYNRRNFLLAGLFLALFLIASYLPLLLKGGIIVDDWGDISQNLGCVGFIDCYKSWFPLFSNRPLAPLPITATTLLFTTHFSYYLVFNTFIYLLAIGLTSHLIWRIVGGYAAFVFFFLASIPFIAMPVIVSPINQSTATVAYLYWVLSLQCLYTFCQTKSKIAYWLSCAFLLFGFLTYEVILPLLEITALLPFILKSDNSKESSKKYFFQFILPILTILAIVVIWQKGIAPRIYDIDHSRLVMSPETALINFKSWVHIFSVQIPALFISSKAYLTAFNFLTGLSIALGIFFASRIQAPTYKSKTENWKFFFVAALCFLGSPFIFILSGVPADSGGYQARGLSSTWFSLAILLSGIIAITHFGILKKLLLIIIITFGLLSSISFSIQRDQYIQSWKLQNIVLDDVITLVKGNAVPKNATIIGNVPQFLSDNYNNEIVFSQPWDFGSALAILTKQHVSGGAVIDTRSGKFHNLQFENGALILDRWWKAPQSNLWFYDYDPATKNSSLVKIENADQLRRIIISYGYKPEINNETGK